MSIPVGGEIGLKPFRLGPILAIGDGTGVGEMGASSDKLNYQANVSSGYVVFTRRDLS